MYSIRRTPALLARFLLWVVHREDGAVNWSNLGLCVLVLLSLAFLRIVLLAGFSDRSCVKWRPFWRKAVRRRWGRRSAAPSSVPESSSIRWRRPSTRTAHSSTWRWHRRCRSFARPTSMPTTAISACRSCSITRHRNPTFLRWPFRVVKYKSKRPIATTDAADSITSPSSPSPTSCTKDRRMSLSSWSWPATATPGGTDINYPTSQFK